MVEAELGRLERAGLGRDGTSHVMMWQGWWRAKCEELIAGGLGNRERYKLYIDRTENFQGSGNF